MQEFIKDTINYKNKQTQNLTKSSKSNKIACKEKFSKYYYIRCTKVCRIDSRKIKEIYGKRRN